MVRPRRREGRRPDKLFEELCALDGVEALALGGSRAGEHFDQASDYDVYLYCHGKPLLRLGQTAIPVIDHLTGEQVVPHTGGVGVAFEENLERLFQDLYHTPERVAVDIQSIVLELEKV